MAAKETLAHVGEGHLDPQSGPAISIPLENESVGDKVSGNDTETPLPTSGEKRPAFHTDYRFWMIMLTLIISTLLTSLESTVVITSLPTIVHDLKMGSNYIWVTNVFFLTRFFYPSAISEP